MCITLYNSIHDRDNDVAVNGFRCEGGQTEHILDLATIIGRLESAQTATIATKLPNRHHEWLEDGSGDTTLELASSVATRSQRISLQEV